MRLSTTNKKPDPSDYIARSSGPTQQHAFRNGPRIVAIETLIPHDIMAGLVLLRIHTDAGTVDGTPVIGHGESYYIPHAVAATLHDWMARRLLGADATAIESHWRFLYERASAFGARGCELRAISAIDLALWDILGQLTKQPIWKLLGVGLKVLLMPKVGQAMATQASQALLKIITTAFTTLQILQKNFFLKVTPR